LLLQVHGLRRLLELRCEYSPPGDTRLESLAERGRRALERQLQLPGMREAVRAAGAGDGEAGGSAQLCLLLEEFVDAVGGLAAGAVGAASRPSLHAFSCRACLVRAAGCQNGRALS
jgi:hypothetical protein